MMRALQTLLCILVVVFPGLLQAQEFALVVTPPRFEDRTQPGTTYRNVFELNNVSPRAAKFTVQTADWKLDAQGSPVFSSALSSDSCRPWVGIEANAVTVKGNGKRRFRFEVAVPANAPRGECRFAIMVEGEPQVIKGNVPLPINGRIGVIVYLAIGDAAPKLVLTQTRSAQVQGLKLPVLRIRNEGDMHGRLEGYLEGVDAKRQRYVLVPDNSPVLMGTTRDLALFPQAPTTGGTPPKIVYPIRIKGRLDAERQRIDIDTTLDQ